MVFRNNKILSWLYGKADGNIDSVTSEEEAFKWATDRGAMIQQLPGFRDTIYIVTLDGFKSTSGRTLVVAVNILIDHMNAEEGGRQ